jgi:hypothetical protein
MSAGLPGDISAVNRLVGNAVLALSQALDQCTAINNMLNNANLPFGTAGLLALGFAQADVTTIQESFAALAELATVAYGTAAQTGAQPTNFFYQAQALLGATPL